MKGYRIRQVYDLPPIQIEVTEHKVEQKECPYCHSIQESQFPSTVSHSVQYGEYKKTDSLFNTLSVHFFETNKRILSRLFWPFYQRRNVSQSYTSFCFSIATFVQEAKEKILQSSVVHFDETGMRVEGKTHWLHTASTPEVTLQHIHENAGKKRWMRVKFCLLFLELPCMMVGSRMMYLQIVDTFYVMPISYEICKEL